MVTNATLGSSRPISFAPYSDEYFEAAASAAGGVVIPLCAQTRGLVWLSYDKSDDLVQVLSDHPDLSWIQLPWAGVDAFSDAIATHSRSGRVFTSAKGAYAEPVAEHALGLLLALMRALPRRSRLNSWESEILGVTLHRKRVTIIGGGGIATELIRILGPFNCEITIVRRSNDDVVGATKTVTFEDLRGVLPSTDALIVAAALTDETRGLIGVTELSLMPQGAFVVNVARGPILDSSAVVDALRSGQLGGAALDVTDPEPLPDGHALWRSPNVLITPHQADTPEMTRPLLAERIAQNVQAFIGSREFVGVVDGTLGY